MMIKPKDALFEILEKNCYVPVDQEQFKVYLEQYNTYLEEHAKDGTLSDMSDNDIEPFPTSYKGLRKYEFTFCCRTLSMEVRRDQRGNYQIYKMDWDELS